jgi:hypothetical protein
MGSSRSELSIQRFMDMFEISAAAGICQAKILHSINMIYYSKTLKTKDTFRYAFLSVSNIVNGVIGRKFLRKEFQHRLPNLKPMNEIPWNCGGQLQYFANITVRKDDLINRVNASTFTGSIDEFRASAGFFLRTLNIELLAVNSISPIHANMKESLSNFLNEFDVEGLLAGHTDKRVRFWHSPSELLATELI